MDLYFTRHGKTEWNEAGKFQGMMGDSPLLSESREEIKAFGTFVKEVPFAKIYASTSKRARDTAEGIRAQLRVPAEIEFRDELRELGLGMLEGQSIVEMKKLYPENLENLRHHLEKYDPKPFAGEPIQDAIERIKGLVKQAIKDNPTGAPLLFVGHGASLTATIQFLAGKQLAELRSMGGLKNSSLSILQTEAPALPYELKSWNEVGFLGQDDTLRDSII